MSGDPLKRVRPGEDFQPSAQAWNAFIDASNWVQQNRHQTGGTVGSITLPDGCVWVKAAADLAQFQPVSIGAPIFTPHSSDDVLFSNWKNGDLIFSAGSVGASDENTFGIVQEPLKSGAIGVARVRGYSRVKINIVNASYSRFATVKSGTTDKMVSQSWGPCRVHYVESGGTGDKWCVVDLHSERYSWVFGKLAGNLSVGGTATLNIYASVGSSTSETTTIFDQGSMLPTGGLNSSPDKWVFGWYDYAIQKVLLEGYKC